MLAVHPVQIGYSAVFGAAALICFTAVSRALNRLEDSDTRIGLVALLATTGLWASFYVGRILSSAPAVQLTFYILGLTAGLTSIGAWLYFCSAYAGKTYHRMSLFRQLAVFVFALILTIKFTSPIHGLYFSTTQSTTPFPHLVIRLGVIHWIVTGLAYALSAVGFYMLFETFQGSNYATGRLSLLVGLAGLPVVFDVIAYSGFGPVITLNYEPIGVALFAVGMLYVADGSFVAVRRFGREQLLAELDEAIVIVDTDWRIKDTNESARELFPDLTDSLNEALADVVPEFDDLLPVADSRVAEFAESMPGRKYLLSAQPLTAGQTTVGQALVLTDVTALERERERVRRQESQLDNFEEAITHELRNIINVVQGNIELAAAEFDAGDTEVEERIRTASAAIDRMGLIVSDLVTLARLGRRAEEIDAVDVDAVANRAFAATATDDHDLTTVDTGEVDADRRRVEQLFESLFEFCVRNDATAVEVAQTPEALVIEDDGRPLSGTDIERAFAYGQAVPDAESGLLLPVVQTLAEAHGWTVDIDAAYDDGVRFVIRR
ncbi:histidine kinase [Halobellus salinus]|uniref:histidine kinase n=1 Tax=Halobellus salinus TaxID=931585 RepID=A0A830EBA5_9EURY|nr:histidine kinase N-terminal 7TM domain-containing protein [Halobellus salinus]GGI94845.1 histidine kinase [Halobellus salinus]SMP20364.1 Signal transduction histidine kinase [Halobellus salinus]